jgi:hypothetical protein
MIGRGGPAGRPFLLHQEIRHRLEIFKFLATGRNRIVIDTLMVTPS